jgi:hypothetical protein
MDKTIDKIILDYEPKSYDSNNKKETFNSTGELLILSADYVHPLDDIDHSPKEINANENLVSDLSIEQQENIPISSKDGRYRIHLGTQPGYYKEGHIKFTESQKLHLKVIDILEFFLISFNINYEVIKKDAFSNSAWGLEPYACILLSCSNEMAQGLAAIIGLALRQDAIGIYTNNNDGYSHPVFTISKSDGALFTENDGLILMNRVTNYCKGLSAQFDENGRNIEFHDFENTIDESVSIEDIKFIINKYSGPKNLYQVTKAIRQSSLLEKEDYQNAINKAGFDSFSKLIELTRLHDGLYDKSEST